MITTFILLVSLGGSLSEYLEGIDVYGEIGDIDWEKTKQDLDIQFAIASCTYGTDRIDDMCLQYIDGIKNAGLKLGVYHYFLGCSDANEQAQNILDSLQDTIFDNDEDVLVIAVEEAGNGECSPSDISESLYTLLTELKKTFKKIYIYTWYSYWQNKVMWQNHNKFFDKFPLWIADYSGGIDNPEVPTTWKFVEGGWTMWQYRNDLPLKGKPPGKEEEVETLIWKSKARSSVF